MFFFVLAVLLFTENLYLLPFVLPFGIVVVVQLIRAATGPGSEGDPRIDDVDGKLRRWHIAAVGIVVGTSSLWIVERTLSQVLFPECGF